MNEDRVWEVTLIIAKHHRLDPMTKDDRCTCGHRTPLGKMFSEHVAREILESGAA